MVAVWSYPWSLLSDDIDATCRELAEHGVTSVTAAAHYHSIRTLEPRSNGTLFKSYTGGCYFDPDLSTVDTPIDPPVHEVAGHTDPFQSIIAGADRHAIDVSAWLVCFHNSKLGSEYPQYRTQSVFGDRHDHAFCPSHPAVQRYFEGIVRSLAGYDIEAINLESLGYPDAFHSHGTRFGHAKNHVVQGRPEELLLSQCFCSACRSRAENHPVDFDRAREVTQRIARNALQQPTASVTSLEELVTQQPALKELFDFRSSVIDELLGRLAAASGETELTYSASDGLGRDPDDGWPSGVALDQLQEHIDRIVALCYTADSDLARRRVQQYKERVDVPVDIGITLDPDLFETESELRSFLADVAGFGDRIHVYNHALMSDTHLDWLDTVTARSV